MDLSLRPGRATGLKPIFKEGGGRFFIDDSGACFKDECGSVVRFVDFETVDQIAS
jgi:hypothetical protein